MVEVAWHCIVTNKFINEINIRDSYAGTRKLKKGFCKIVVLTLLQYFLSCSR